MVVKYLLTADIDAATIDMLYAEGLVVAFKIYISNPREIMDSNHGYISHDYPKFYLSACALEKKLSHEIVVLHVHAC